MKKRERCPNFGQDSLLDASSHLKGFRVIEAKSPNLIRQVGYNRHNNATDVSNSTNRSETIAAFLGSMINIITQIAWAYG